MTKLSLGEAARVSGLSKPTISKYLKTGRISGQQREDSVWEIDQSEIVRLMASRDKDAPQRGKVPPTKAAEQAAPEAQESALEVELRLTRQMLEEAREREAKALEQLATALESERAAHRQVAGLLSDLRGRAVEQESGVFAKMVKKFRGA